jgi:hypothetical protein
MLLNVCNPAGLFLSAGQLASSVAANIQLKQVKAMLSTLQLLSGATLAASVVGIGVSAAGFALVLHRLGNIEQAIKGVHQDVLDTRIAIERVDVQLATAHRSLMESLLYRAEEAWVRSDADAVWRQLDGPLDQAQRYWRNLVGVRPAMSIFLDARFTLQEAVAAYEAALVLAGARVQTLLLIEELRAALDYAREFALWHEGIVTGLTPPDIAAAKVQRLAEEKGLSVEDARAKLRRAAEFFLAAVRETQLYVTTRPELLQALVDRGISGRKYVETVRERGDVPLLALPLP